MTKYREGYKISFLIKCIGFKEITVFCELTYVRNARYFKFLKLTSF